MTQTPALSRWRLIRAIAFLPGTVMVLIPALILAFTGIDVRIAELTLSGLLSFWAGLLCAAAGMALVGWCMAIFLQRGLGTPAPWDPPRQLVVSGPYRHVRNPMIAGVLLILAAEALLLRSWGLAVWWVVFFLGNALYFPLVEEPGLVNRFGDDYRDYKSHVPRWVPRRDAWHKNRGPEEE